MIRRARIEDIPALCRLADEMRSRSPYGERVKRKVGAFEALCEEGIRRHGGDTCVFVAERNETIQGFIFGTKCPIFGAGDKDHALDAYYYLSPNGNARDALRLVRAYEDWARSHENIIEARLTATDAVVDPALSARIFTMSGYKQGGTLFHKRLR